MDIMEYLFLEMPCILLSMKKIEVANNMAEIDEINARISMSEEEILTWCSLENLYEAKGFYEGKILRRIKKDLFGVATKDLLEYTDKLISMKRERER